MLRIQIESRPVSDCLGRVGKVILDYPSTSLYEVAAAGIPIFSLYHELLDIRPERFIVIDKNSVLVIFNSSNGREVVLFTEKRILVFLDYIEENN